MKKGHVLFAKYRKQKILLLVLLLRVIPGAVVYAESIEQNGIQVDFSLTSIVQSRSLQINNPDRVESQTRPKAHSDAEFRFRISDISGAPLAGAYPAAWMQRRAETIPTDNATCKNMVSSFIGGSILSQPTLNLNVYYVLVLNDDATVSVVDPLFSFGGTNLLTMIALSSTGYDWSLSEKNSGLYISLPGAQRLAMIDTIGFTLSKEIELGVQPGSVALQPDEFYVWVAYSDTDANDREIGGVIAINADTGDIAKRIQLSAGQHQMAFSPDNRYAFVTNALGNNVSVIDIARLEKISDIQTGERPVSIAYSIAADAVYVSHAGDGAVVGIDAKSFQPHPRVILDPGLGQIRFAPNGRHAVVVNPANDNVYIWDAVDNRISKSGKIDSGPDQVTFSSTLAYVRHRNSDTIYMIPMDVIVDPELTLQVVDFPGGQNAFGIANTPADSIVQTPGENAVLVAHPVDRQVYYYKEGMAAPMGSFKNFQRSARAVLAVDRTLQETLPGQYETVGRLDEAGTYDVAFFMESPRVVHCFSVRVMPGLQTPRKDFPQVVAVLLPDQVWKTGQSSTVKFRLQSSLTGEPLQGFANIETLTVLAPGVWQARNTVVEIAAGVYSFEWTPPAGGAYFIRLDSEWDEHEVSPPTQLMLRVL